MAESAVDALNATSSKLAPIPMKYRDPTGQFPFGWYCVADSNEITSETLKPVSYLNLQLIVYRDADGVAHVADAYCPHLGAHLASHDGRIENGKIVCPFHKWQFDGVTGKCTHIPYSKSIPPQAKLKTYETREVSGMILMWWHPLDAAPSFEPYHGRIQNPKDWVQVGRLVLEGRVPFRDLKENLFDTAHIHTLHNSHGLPAISKLTYPDYGLTIDYALDDVPEDFPLTSIQMNYTGITMNNQHTVGEGFEVVSNSSATPIDDERMELVVRFHLRDTGSAETNMQIGKAFTERTMMEIKQDFAVLDYKKHIERPLLCAGDGPIMKYREYAARFFV